MSNQMKLYPIIYELAKTSRQAEQAGESAIQDLADNFKASVDEIKIVLEMAAALHFERI